MHSAGVGGALVGALGFLSESPLDGLLGVITDVVDPEKNYRIYIGTVSVGDITFHCHSAVHEKQVRQGMIRVAEGCAFEALVFSLQLSAKVPLWTSCKSMAKVLHMLLFPWSLAFSFFHASLSPTFC